MPDMWMDVDTALSEVPVNIMPLIDDTDFKTREESVVYNQAGMDLVWNFVTSVGAMTQTAVTPTTAGDYDWTNQGNGMYSIEIPASGGASINNDTEGVGWFTGFATGILPWRGPTIGFRAAALNNALIDGGDYLEVDLLQIGGVSQSATDLKDFADAGYDPATNKVEGVKTVDTTTTNTDMVSEPPTAAAVADQVWDEAKSGHVGAGSFGEEVQSHALTSEVAAVVTDTQDIQSRIPAALVGGKMDSDVSNMQANVVDASALAQDAAQEVADEVLNRDIAGGGSGNTRNVRNALRALRNRTAIAGGTLTVYQENDTSAAWTASVSTAAGDPIDEVDPA